jgi:proliferating cell nuclear antigen PCNA
MEILKVVTEHSPPLKTLFEVLKDILTEVNIEFRSDQQSKKELEANGNKKGAVKKTNSEDDRNCMKITAVDPTKTVLISLKLLGKNFTTFKCKQRKILAGVNMPYIYKSVFKTTNKLDIISFSLNHDNKNILKVDVETPDTGKSTEFDIKLLDLKQEKTIIPDITFEAIITIDSQEFCKLCRDMNANSNYIDIQCLPDEISFRCKGEGGNRKTIYQTNNSTNPEKEENNLVSIYHGSKESPTSPQIVQGVYELKNLVLFSKCATLSPQIEIFMKNNCPLVIKYTVATLGRLLVCISPITEDTTRNSNYSDEDQFYSDDDMDA